MCRRRHTRVSRIPVVNDVAEGVRVENVDPASPAAKAGVAVGILRDKKESSVKATINEARPRAGFRRPA